MTFARVTLFAIAATIIPHTVVAQRRAAPRPIELGIDAALIHESRDNAGVTTIALAADRLRGGFFLSDAVSFEPSLAIRYARVTFEDPQTGRDETSSGTSYEMDFGLLYHFSTDRAQTQTYMRPFVGIRGSSGDGNHGSQAVFGAGLGFKKPLSNRVGARFEVGYAHRTEDEPSFPSTNSLFFSLGLSFFTH